MLLCKQTYTIVRIFSRIDMARRNNSTGGGIVALIIFVVVFLLVYNHFVNPYTSPQQILSQYFESIWSKVIASLISVVGLTWTAIFIAVIVSVLYLNSRKKGRW